MTEDEYRNAKITLQRNFESSMIDLQREFALSNNPVQIGMLVTDHNGSIIVDDIDINLSSGSALPTCIYRGVVATKQGRGRKDKSRGLVYQINMVSYEKRNE